MLSRDTPDKIFAASFKKMREFLLDIIMYIIISDDKSLV